MSQRRRGFTFLEIMLVVLIIGILVSIVVPRFGSSSRQARINAARLAIRSTELAIDQFEIHYGHYPRDLQELVNPPPPDDRNMETPEFLDRMPEDAWGHPLIYNFPPEIGGRHFDLYSMGPNGVDDRGGEDDITNIVAEDTSSRRRNL